MFRATKNEVIKDDDVLSVVNKLSMDNGHG